MRDFSLSVSRLAMLTGLAATLGGTAGAQDMGYSLGVITLDPRAAEARDAQAGAADRATSMYASDFELERARNGDLKDVFSGIASVAVGGGIPLTQKIFVNGVDMLNLGVTIDGTAQNNRQFHHVSANAIDPGLLRQVRADATVSPADAGPGALAGSVVFETIDPDDILGEDDSFGGTLRLSYTDNGGTSQGAVTMATRTGALSGLLYTKRAKGDDYTDGGGATRLGSRTDLTSYLGKVVLDGPEGHRLTFSAQKLDDSALRQDRANFGGFRGVDDNLVLYDTTRSSYALTFETVETEGMWNPYLQLGFSETTIGKPDPWDGDGVSNTWSATASNTFDLGGDNTIVAGIDWQKKYGRYASAAYSEYYNEHAHNLGVFAQARLSPNERTRLSFGLRHDWNELEGVTGDKVSTRGFSGNASVAYDVSDIVTLRGGVSSVFGGIDLEDNFIFWDLTSAGSYDALRASRARNATIGIDVNPGAFTFSAEVFRTEIANARNADTTFDFEAQGVNLGTTYDWGSGFGRLTLSHSDTKVNGKRTGAYEVLDFGTPLGTVIALEVEQDTGVQGLRVGGGIDAALRYDTPAASDNDHPAFAAINVFAEYTPPSMDNLTLRLDVDNLFDAEYYDRATYGAEYDSITPFNEPGRTITLTAVVGF